MKTTWWRCVKKRVTFARIQVVPKQLNTDFITENLCSCNDDFDIISEICTEIGSIFRTSQELVL
jgi:hypothetical protein